MILILSKSDLETSTELVIDWIDYFKTKWKRVNGIDLEKDKMRMSFSNENEEAVVGNHTFNPKDVKIVWFRRWIDGFPHSNIDVKDLRLSFELKANLISERRKVKQTFFDFFRESKWLSFPNDDYSKLQVLRHAVKAGLRIPQTHILNNREDIDNVISSGTRFITKSISDSPIFFTNDFAYLLYTREFLSDEVDFEGDFFYPTLLQERIEKAYELRIFYLDEKCYSMAIFSQMNSQTKEDFRQYDQERPNRWVPYALPEHIEKSIVVLMKELNLITGSIDMLKSKSGEYIFLEVNPIGQFSMTSLPCNYYLEKKIAEYLVLHN